MAARRNGNDDAVLMLLGKLEKGQELAHEQRKDLFTVTTAQTIAIADLAAAVRMLNDPDQGRIPRIEKWIEVNGPVIDSLKMTRTKGTFMIFGLILAASMIASGLGPILRFFGRQLGMVDL